MPDEVKPHEVNLTGDSPVVYTNMAQVSFTPEEAIIDFGIRVSETEASRVVRVAMTRYHAKRLAAVMIKSVIGYESQYGEIPLEIRPLPVSSTDDAEGSEPA